MKRIFFIAVLLCAMTGPGAWAQHKPHNHPPKDEAPTERMAKIVKDLSQKQKKQIETISDTYSSDIKVLRKQLHIVRDSIHYYMSQKADNSIALMPMFEKEAALQLTVNKKMYQMKVALDSVLTDSQYQQLLQHEKEKHPKKK